MPWSASTEIKSLFWLPETVNKSALTLSQKSQLKLSEALRSRLSAKRHWWRRNSALNKSKDWPSKQKSLNRSLKSQMKTWPWLKRILTTTWLSMVCLLSKILTTLSWTLRRSKSIPLFSQQRCLRLSTYPSHTISKCWLISCTPTSQTYRFISQQRVTSLTSCSRSKKPSL